MDLLILGAGGHGVNCLEVARSTEKFEYIAFLDDGHEGEKICDCPVVGKIKDIKRFTEYYDVAFVAIGDNKRRKELVQGLIESSYSIPTLISPLANVSKYSKIGFGTIVFPFVSIEAYSSIEEGCVIATGAVVGHNATMHQFSFVYENTVVRPYAHIGKISTIGSGSVIAMHRTITEGSVVSEGSILQISVENAKLEQTEEWTLKHRPQFGEEPGFF